MIIVAKKRNLALIATFFLCSLLIFNLNMGHWKSINTSAPGNKKTVLLDPGHGGEDPGAVSDFNGLKEKDVNLKIAQDVKSLLESKDYTVLMTRETDTLDYDASVQGVTKKRAADLINRKKMMDECGADVVVSIHLNKYGGTSQQVIKGAQVFYPPGDNNSKDLANFLQNSIIEIADQNNNRVALEKKVEGRPIIIFNNPKTTISIVECGFLSDKDEAEKLASEDYQKKLAESIGAGILKYFESPRGTTSPYITDHPGSSLSPAISPAVSPSISSSMQPGDIITPIPETSLQPQSSLQPTTSLQPLREPSSGTSPQTTEPPKKKGLFDFFSGKKG